MAEPQSSILYVNANLAPQSNSPGLLFRAVSRSGAILEKPSDWCVAVARATFPSNIWMWQPTLLLGQTDSPPLITTYQVSLSYNGVYSDPAPLLLIRADLFSPVPPVPLTSQPATPYAAVYDPITIQQMNNNALKIAFADLVTKCGGTIGSFSPQPQAPYFTYDTASGAYTLNCFPLVAYDRAQSGESIRVYYSATYAAFLAGFRYEITNLLPTSSVSTSYRDVELVLESVGNNWLDSDAGPPTSWLAPPGDITSVSTARDPATALLQVRQHWPSYWAFSAMSSISITSSLPTIAETTDPPLQDIGATANQTSAILTDFVPDYTVAPGAFQQPLVYNTGSTIPGARFVELVGGAPLTNFVISCNWTDSLGVSRPLIALNNSQSASIKLVFVRKDYLRTHSVVIIK
jgi:hypothetical protein